MRIFLLIVFESNSHKFRFKNTRRLVRMNFVTKQVSEIHKRTEITRV